MREGLARHAVTVGSMTLLSRILGFVRDMVLARYFGAGLGMDAFFIAFKIPNFLRRLFAEGAFSLAFVPVLSEYKTQRDAVTVRALVDQVAGTLAGILLVVSLLGSLASPVLVMIFAPGFIGDAEKFDLAAQMLRITFPYILFISLAAFAGGILNTYGRFALPAFAPVLLNLVLIGASILVAPQLERPEMALAGAVFMGGILQLVCLLPGLARLRLIPRFRWGWQDSGVRRILKLMGPAVFGSSVAQINLLFDTLIASFLATGSVSWLYYSDRIVEFPLGVFGIALSTAILPSLARSHARGSQESFMRTLDQGLRWVLLLGAPAALGLFLLAGPILATLFQYNQFGSHDTQMAAVSLMAYAAGLPAFILVKVLAPAFYSRQDTGTPVRIAVVAMAANMGLNVILVVSMLHWEIAGPHAGLALATSASAYLNAGLLYRRLRRDQLYTPGVGWRPMAVRVLFAALLLGLLLGAGTADLGHWAAMNGTARVMHLAAWIAAGAAVYLGVLRLLGERLVSFGYGTANE
jgi:putative peptidoglycan lipid II flippase